MNFATVKSDSLLKNNTLGGFEAPPSKQRKITAPKEWWEAELKEIYINALTAKNECIPITNNPFLRSTHSKTNFLLNAEQDADNFYRYWFADKLIPLYEKWLTSTSAEITHMLEDELEASYRDIAAIIGRESMQARLMQNANTIDRLRKEKNRFAAYFKISITFWLITIFVFVFIPV